MCCCVVVRCSVLQCIAVCCEGSESKETLTFVIAHEIQCVAVCCGVLQCVAVCCSELQYSAVCCSVLQLVTVC